LTAHVVVDTGPLVALLNRRDNHHAWAVATFATLSAPLFTCEAVLTEAARLTRAPQRLLKMVSEGTLRLELDVTRESDALSALLAKYGPRMDLADACVVRMSELRKSCRVLTLDRRDFSSYRRNGRGIIPLIAPQ